MRPELLHPMLVHIPIAIALLWIVFETFCLLFEKPSTDFDLVFVMLAGIATIFAYGATLSGELAESLVKTDALKDAIESHETIGGFVVWSFALLFLIATVAMATKNRMLRHLRFLVGSCILVLIVVTSYRGAMLVYNFGAGVNSLDSPATSQIVGERESTTDR